MYLVPTDAYHMSAILCSTSSGFTSCGPYGGGFVVDFERRLSLLDGQLVIVARSGVDGDCPVVSPNASIVAFGFRCSDKYRNKSIKSNNLQKFGFWCS